jgi:hypothetical protein
MAQRTPVQLPPACSVPSVLRHVRKSIGQRGGAVLYAPNGRTLRKVEDRLAEDPTLVTDLTEHGDGVRLVVTRAGQGYAWRG